MIKREQKLLYLHFWHPGHATDKNDFSDVGLGDFCVLHGLVARLDRLLDQITDNLLKLGPVNKTLQLAKPL